MQSQKDNLYTPVQAAVYLDVALGSLNNKRSDPDTYGKGPSYYKVGGRIKYDKEDLDLWKKQNTKRVD